MFKDRMFCQTFKGVKFNPQSVLYSSWGVPLAITIAAVSLGKIGYDASEVSVGWCWVSIEASDRVLWMLLTGKIWEFMAYLTLPVLYILIKRHIYIAVRSKPGFYQLHASSYSCILRISFSVKWPVKICMLNTVQTRKYLEIGQLTVIYYCLF